YKNRFLGVILSCKPCYTLVAQSIGMRRALHVDSRYMSVLTPEYISVVTNLTKNRHLVDYQHIYAWILRQLSRAPKSPKLQFVSFPKNAVVIIISMNFESVMAGISMNGLPVLILPSIEKRFSLSGKELGIISAANDVAALILVVFISFYGDYGNKIKWVGGGACVSGFGLLLFSLPHFMVGPYDVPDFQPGKGGICVSSKNNSSSGSCDSNDSGAMWYYMLLFVIAQVIHGAGICPLYSLVPAYLDENVEPKQMPVYIGLFYLSALLGPGVGILIGGQFLSVFVDIDQPSGLNLTPKDSRWIGAWWLGFLVFGLLFFLLAIIISGFPSSLPGAKERREKHIREGNLNKKSDSNEARLKEIFPGLKSLLMNWTLLFNTIGLSVEVIFIYSFVPFLGKIVQLKFGLDPVSNGYVLSAVMAPTMMAGVILGALVVRQFPIKSVCKRSAFYVVVSQSFAMIVPFLILLPGCLNVNMAGVSTSYTDSSTAKTRINSTHEQVMATYSTDVLISQCNVNCSCSIDHFTPVCGSDSIVYPNPCYAGCTATYDNKSFGSCSCIVTDTSKSGTARQGYCDRDCKNLAIFFVFIGICLCVFFSCIVPLTTVVLRYNE
ncbi:solute carrier organic anion transporter family member 4A1-like, partial [Paramuricea clavata]